MTNDSAIHIQGLTKSYGSVRALRGVDLTVQRGEIFGFLGPNGAGKTTAIRCMMDLIRPDGGILRVLGMDPQRESTQVRARVGYLPGEPNLDGNLTGHGAIRYLSGLRGQRASDAFARELAGRLDADLDRPIKNLSHGNKQKIGIVLAFVHKPDLIILDEPTTGLDPLIQQETLQIVRDAQSEGATVFFSSHIISVVEALAKRVGIIRQGVVVEIADTGELRERAVRRARIRFREPVDAGLFADLRGVTVLSSSDPTSLLLQVTGEMDTLIDKLYGLPVSDLETERATLEEIFLAYYDHGRKED